MIQEQQKCANEKRPQPEMTSELKNINNYILCKCLRINTIKYGFSTYNKSFIHIIHVYIHKCYMSEFNP